jgi:hypothetical protein
MCIRTWEATLLLMCGTWLRKSKPATNETTCPSVVSQTKGSAHYWAVVHAWCIALATLICCRRMCSIIALHNYQPRHQLASHHHSIKMALLSRSSSLTRRYEFLQTDKMTAVHAPLLVCRRSSVLVFTSGGVPRLSSGVHRVGLPAQSVPEHLISLFRPSYARRLRTNP